MSNFAAFSGSYKKPQGTGLIITDLVTYTPLNFFDRCKAKINTLIENKSSVTPNPPIMSLIDQEPMWHGQAAFEALRQEKLNWFSGLPLESITQFLKRLNPYQLNFYSFTLMAFAVPALIQLVSSPFAAQPYDLIQTSSIVQKTSIKPDMWLTGWKKDKGQMLSLFNLQSPETTNLDLDYSARTHVSGLREDILSWGDKQMPSKAMMVLQRPLSTIVDHSSLQIETERRAQELNFEVNQTSNLSIITSKFGAIEVMDFILTQDKTTNSCLAFRSQNLQPDLKLSGWLCGSQAKAVERPQLSCFINRMELIGAAQNVTLHKIFQNTENKRGDCPSRITASLGKKNTSWMESENALPKLKGFLDE